MSDKKKYKNKDFKTNQIKLLEEIKNIIKDINLQITNFSNNFKNYIKNIENNFKQLNESIDYLIDFIKLKDDPSNINNAKSKENFIEDIKKKYTDYDKSIFIIYENNYIKKIQELNIELNNKINKDIPEHSFDPPNICPFLDSDPNIDKNTNYSSKDKEEKSQSVFEGYKSFYKEEENNNIFDNDNEINMINIDCNCSICNNNKAICYCEKCNKLFCKSCSTISIGNHKHRLQFFNKLKNQIEIDRLLFLNSLQYTIKNTLMKANILLNSEIMKIQNLNEKSINKNNNNQIKDNNSINISEIKRRLFKYPHIQDSKSFNSELEYLKNINNILINDLNQNNINELFYISEMNDKIKNLIGNIFIDEKYNLFKEALDIIENNFYSDDENNKESLSFKINEEEFDNTKNMLYYVISIISQRKNIIFNKLNIKTVFINKLNEKLKIDQNNIFVSFNNKNNFINTYIKSKDFFDTSLKTLKKIYPDFEVLYEYKIIFENILNNKNFKNYLDYKGNTICPNSSYNLMRGTEKYYPPYGWFGIGLNVLGKYDEGSNDWLDKDSNKWAIAYYSVGQNSSSNKVIEILNEIIIEQKLNQGNNQFKCSSMDKRHPNKKVGVGIYLTPDINIAERFSGRILINNKKYRVVLMAKVLIEKIREPNDINFWILDKEFV